MHVGNYSYIAGDHDNQCYCTTYVLRVLVSFKMDREAIFLGTISKGLPKTVLYRLTLVGKTARSTRKEAMFTERAILLSAQHDWAGTHIPKSNIQLYIVTVIEEVSLF